MEKLVKIGWRYINMGLKAPVTENKSFKAQEPLEPGTYSARVVQIIDMGLQPQREWMGKAKPPAQVINITYELSDEFMKDEDGNDIEDKPRWISEMITLRSLSSDKATSTLRYKVFDPDNVFGGDFSLCIGVPVMITIANNQKDGRIYNNISAVGQMRERDVKRCPPLVNKGVFFDLDDPDVNVFNSFPQFIKDRITKNLNYNGSVLQKRLSEAPSKEEEEQAPEITEENSPF